MLNSHYNDDEDDYHERDSQGPEISVGTTSIVGIFFVLVLICAVFFGIGYTLGRRQGIAQTLPQPQAQPRPAAPPSVSASTQKPSPVSVETPAHTSTTVSDSSPASPAAAPAPAKPSPAPAAATPAPAAGILVQIAALTHQQDADNEVAELHKRGYDVFARHDPNDRFIRIQIGPFANRKEAKEMCDRLLASGYNAIIK